MRRSKLLGGGRYLAVTPAPAVPRIRTERVLAGVVVVAERRVVPVTAAAVAVLIASTAATVSATVLIAPTAATVVVLVATAVGIEQIAKRTGDRLRAGVASAATVAVITIITHNRPLS